MDQIIMHTILSISIFYKILSVSLMCNIAGIIYEMRGPTTVMV